MKRLTTIRNCALLAIILAAIAAPTSTARALEFDQYCEDVPVQFHGETIICTVCTYDDSPCTTWSCPGRMGVGCPE